MDNREIISALEKEYCVTTLESIMEVVYDDEISFREECKGIFDIFIQTDRALWVMRYDMDGISVLNYD